MRSSLEVRATSGSLEGRDRGTSFEARKSAHLSVSAIARHPGMTVVFREVWKR